MTTRDEAVAAADETGYPVVLKTAEDEIHHKTEADGVRLGLGDGDAVGAAYDDLAARLGPRVVVQSQLAGVEVALGIVYDPLLGPLVVVAAGGTLVELVAERAVALPPLDRETARAMVAGLRVARLLDGYRGSQPADVDALVDVVVALGQLAVELGDRLDGVDLNPVLVAPALRPRRPRRRRPDPPPLTRTPSRHRTTRRVFAASLRRLGVFSLPVAPTRRQAKEGKGRAMGAVVSGSLTALGAVDLWLGLKNSDDIGTRFDVQVEAYRNGALVASGERRCIQGVTNGLSVERAVSFGSFPPAAFNGTSDVFSLKISTRIGTTASGAFCGGHSNAVGLRSYFDSQARSANVPATISPTSGGNAWTMQAPMPTARNYLAAVATNGTLYAVGGFNSTGNAVGALETYDPATNTWTTKASMPTERASFGIAAIGGRLYAAGGSNNATARLATLEAYDLATDAWTAKAPMPTARNAPAVAAINGILYAVGGSNNTGFLATLEAYDPATDTWTAKAPMPTARERLAVAAINGILYAVGGSDNFDLATVEAYDPATDTWTTKASMPTERNDLAVDASSGILYAAGGYNGSILATLEAYDPATDVWSAKAPMPTARFGLAAGAINGILYTVGGYDGNSAVATVEAYQP